MASCSSCTLHAVGEPAGGSWWDGQRGSQETGLCSSGVHWRKPIKRPAPCPLSPDSREGHPRVHKGLSKGAGGLALGAEGAPGGLQLAAAALAAQLGASGGLPRQEALPAVLGLASL